MIRRFFFLAALAASAPSWSAVTLSNFPPNPGLLPGGGWQFTPGTTFANPTPARAWVNGVYGGVPAAVVTDTMALTGPAGKLTVAVGTAATAANIAKALAGVAGRLYLPLTVGMAAYDLLAASGVRQGSTGAEMDPGADPVTTTRTMYGLVDFPSIPLAQSKAAICLAWKNYIQSSGGTSASSSEYDSSMTYSQDDSLDVCVTVKTITSTPKLPWLSTVTNTSLYQRSIYINNSSPVTGCSPVVDSITGQSYVPGKYSDGKCITGRYEPVTESNVISRVSPSVQADPSSSAKAAISSGASIESSPYSITGPASQTGTPTSKTTTGPAGITTTTTTPTYSYTYGGNTITVSTTNTTNVTNVTNEGDVTTTTETTVQPGNDDKGMCSLYPDSLACMKPGTPSDAEQIPIDRRPVTITKDPRWASNAGACTRGAIQLTSGASINLWQPFCDFFALIRGVVVGMFGLAGAFIFRNGVK